MQPPIPLKNFYVPILESVTELGGKAKVEDILPKVEQKMKTLIANYPKWKDRAEWAGMDLMRSGHLSYTYPATVWEITESGKKFCEELKKKQ